MKAINVERDKYGMWTHPDLPNWGENTSSEQAEAWFASKGLTHHLVLMDDELGERWGKGELESCAEWQPEPLAKDSFLVGIWDSEDGVVAMFAQPLKEDEMLTQEIIDVMKIKLSKGMKALAKFNALKLMSYQMHHQCNANDTFFGMDGVTEELKYAINSEIAKVVKQLDVRAEKLNKEYSGKLIDIVEISQSSGDRY